MHLAQYHLQVLDTLDELDKPVPEALLALREYFAELQLLPGARSGHPLVPVYPTHGYGAHRVRLSICLHAPPRPRDTDADVVRRVRVSHIDRCLEGRALHAVAELLDWINL